MCQERFGTKSLVRSGKKRYSLCFKELGMRLRNQMKQLSAVGIEAFSEGGIMETIGPHWTLKHLYRGDIAWQGSEEFSELLRKW